LTACWNEKADDRPTWKALFADLKAILQSHSSELEGTNLDVLGGAKINAYYGESTSDDVNKY
jgi:hypothetical protein